jgi:hypothetical protein
VIASAMVDVTCQRGDQRASRSPAAFGANVAAVLEERRGQKVALSDTLSAGRDRDGGERAGRERSRGRRWSGKRSG